MSHSIGGFLKAGKNNLDFIRLLAAAVVIFSHSFPLTLGSGKTEPMYRWTDGQMQFGELAVIVFFLISGFLITRSFERSENLFSFLKARVLRIFPALIVVVFLSAFVLGPIMTSEPIGDYFTNKLTYTHLSMILLHPFSSTGNLPGVFVGNPYSDVVNGSLWTLQFEFICYLAVAAMGVIKVLNKPFTILLLIGSLAGMQLNISSDTISYMIYFLGYFSAGMLFYLFRNEIKLRLIYLLGSIVAILLGAFVGYLEESLVIFGGYVVFYLAFSPVIRMPYLTKRFGDYSYGLYIYAFPIQQVISHNIKGINPYLEFIISLPIALIFAIISWHLIEKRALALKLSQATYKSPAQPKPSGVSFNR